MGVVEIEIKEFKGETRDHVEKSSRRWVERNIAPAEDGAKVVQHIYRLSERDYLLRLVISRN